MYIVTLTELSKVIHKASPALLKVSISQKEILVSYTLQVCPYLYLMVHVCLKVGHVGLLGGQPIPSPGGRLQLSAVSSSSFSQWYLSVRK